LDEATEDLTAFVETLSTLPGLVSIVLYGSYSRGDFGAKSDVDIYVLFDEVKNAKAAESIITKQTALSRSFMKPIVDSIDKISETQPSLLQSIFAEGQVLYWKGLKGFRASKFLDLAPWLIFTYELGSMPPAKKAMVAYVLYGKKGRGGLINEAQGRKLGRAAFMIPKASEEKIVAFLRKHRIQFEIFEVWASK
jgi:predicted nucleotidyltransferase